MPLPKLLIAAAACCLSSCAQLPKQPPPSQVTRGECMKMAEAYRVHKWTASVANVRHGPDSKGVRVDTPDIMHNPGGKIPGWWVPGKETEGVPYQWGGFSTVEEFDAGVKAGKAAGDVYTDAKRTLLDDAVSTEAVGIDCSGYISRLWKMPRSYSTRELPEFCNEISWSALKPGDILNTHNAHCLLFAGWDDKKRIKLLAYETGCPPSWRVLSHAIDVEWLKSLGYKAYRYRGMLD
ncbi:MAG: hypothetical protein JWO89_2623 [Verrucomicrobiaceae bacterium]|nr:hypothetical protein [Verrucomicrobiaceae bacterium]